VKLQRVKDPEVQPILVVFSDGEANVPLAAGQPVMDELCALAREIKHDTIYSIAIDTNSDSTKSENMIRIAESLGATYHHISNLRPENVVDAVRESETLIQF
jgi:magnesium chelatase subunit D